MLIGDYQSLAELFSSGKSGSFFYYTSDGKFLLKTISKGEFSFLKHLLPEYLKHISKFESTLMSWVYGLHKMQFLKRSGVPEKPIRFVIMNNVFHTNKEIHVRFDLKGST